MNTHVDLAKELAYRNPIPFAPVPGAYKYIDETPAHRFTTVVAPVLGGRFCVALPSRDFFDECLAAAIVAFIDKYASSAAPKRSIMLLQDFFCHQYKFDAVALLGPSTAKQFEYENDFLNDRALVAFPVYRCELSGDESAEAIDLIRHEFLPSLDWKRPPCPKVMMAYQNKKNKTGSPPRLAKMATVLFELCEMSGTEGNWVELRNYAGCQFRVTWSQGFYEMRIGGQGVKRLDKTALIDQTTALLVHNEIMTGLRGASGMPDGGH